MNVLTQKTSSEFLSRFYSFNDAILRKVELVYADTGKRNISLCIASRDAQETQNEGWVSVRLDIIGAEDFRFSETAKTSSQVLSQGIHICWFGNAVGVDMGYFIDPPDNRAELTASDFFVIGSQLAWTVEPYSKAA